METTYINGWYVRSVYSDALDRFVAWAKREMFTADDIISEPGEVFFEIGITRQRAIDRLITSL